MTRMFISGKLLNTAEFSDSYRYNEIAEKGRVANVTLKPRYAHSWQEVALSEELGGDATRPCRYWLTRCHGRHRDNLLWSATTGRRPTMRCTGAHCARSLLTLSSILQSGQLQDHVVTMAHELCIAFRPVQAVSSLFATKRLCRWESQTALWQRH